MHVSISRRELLRLVTASLPAVAIGCAPIQSNERYAYVDAMPRLLDLAVTGNLEANPIATFRSQIEARYEAYAAIDPISDESLREYLADPRALVDRSRAVSLRLPAALHERWTNFSAVLPLDATRVTVYLLAAPEDSLGGAVRASKNRRDMLLLGSEVLAQALDEPLGFAVFLDHELAHLHHHQVNSEMRQASASYFSGSPSALYRLVWLEGLAAYASGVLNPKASARELFRSSMLPEQMQEQWQYVRDEFLRLFRASDGATVQQYVYGGDPSSGLPPRAGYYFGSRLAANLSKRGISLPEMFQLRGNALSDALLTAAAVIEPNR